jgi:hypothetical protein
MSRKLASFINAKGRKRPTRVDPRREQNFIDQHVPKAGDNPLIKQH